MIVMHVCMACRGWMARNEVTCCAWFVLLSICSYARVVCYLLQGIRSYLSTCLVVLCAVARRTAAFSDPGSTCASAFLLVLQRSISITKSGWRLTHWWHSFLYSMRNLHKEKDWLDLVPLQFVSCFQEFLFISFCDFHVVCQNVTCAVKGIHHPSCVLFSLRKVPELMWGND